MPPLLFDFCFWTGYFNSCLNPFIYASTSREYKRAFHAILRCQWSKQRDGLSTLPPDSYPAHSWPGNWKVAAHAARATRLGNGQQRPPARRAASYALRSTSCDEDPQCSLAADRESAKR